MSRFFSEKYSKLIPYTPGEQPKDMKYVKLNTNESPYAPPADVTKAVTEAAGKLQLYSDPTCSLLVKKLAEIYGIGEDEVLVNNGSDESLFFAFSSFCDQKTGAAFPNITYGFYPVFAEFLGIPFTEIPLKENFTIDINDYKGLGKTIFIANPNAPTGIALSPSQIEEILTANPDNVVVIDEAYVDFGAESCVPLIHKYDNLLVTMTFSKSRSLAGARLGFAIGNASLIQDLNTVKYSTNPYNVNSMTIAAGIASLNNEEYTRANCRKIAETRAYTTKKLEGLGFTVLPSYSNFIFARHPELDGEKLYLTLKERGILIRHFTKPEICQYNRITIGTPEQMDILIEAVTKILNEK